MSTTNEKPEKDIKVVKVKPTDKKERKKDNIFESQQGDHDEEFQNTSFQVNPFFTDIFSQDYIENVENIDMREIFRIIEQYMDEVWEEQLSDPTYNFKKVEIQTIYRDIHKRTKIYSKIEVIMVLCSFLGIEPNKVYNFLGNAYKNELINEIDKKTGLISKKGIVRLF